MTARPLHSLPRRARTLVAVLACATLFAPGLAGADTKAERADVQRRKAAAAAELDTLKATDAQIEAALAVLEEDVRVQEAALQEAERRVSAAEAAVAAAEERVEAKLAEIDTLEQAVQDLAVEAYMQPPASNGLFDALGSSSIGEAELKQALLAAKSAAQVDSLDLLERAREDLDLARTEAAEAAEAAEAGRAAVEARVAEVRAARDRQADTAAEIDRRLDHKLGEIANLEKLDQQLAARLEQEEAARLAASARPSGSGGRGGPISITGSGSIVSVRGIQVHQSIASRVRALLEQAESAGISLYGGGYRDPAEQIALRKAHCGTSYYAVYEMSPSQCSPPTARPGSSLHEQGLAIDFTHGGRAITSRSSVAFRWLAANAASYGLYNLPSEPWHWSVNGN